MSNLTKIELRQKYLNEQRDFFLEPNRIRLYTKDLDGEVETYVQYENITPTTRTITQQDGRLYIAAISFGIFALIGFVLYLIGIPSLMRWAPLWGIASVIFFGFHFYKRRRYFLIDLANQQSIFFHANKPSQDELSKFVKSIYEWRKKYLREKYFVINSTNDPNSEVEKFRFLLSEEIITESEYQEMKTLLTAQIAGDTIDGIQKKSLVN